MMNKAALKTFAKEARKELLERVKTKAMQIGITAKAVQQADIASSNTIFIGEKPLQEHEIIQRNKLISRINEIGFDRVMDEVAYTWFNRFTALRFMEVNDYLPTRVRVLSSEDPANIEPDMMKEALTLDLELDKEYVYGLTVNNEADELFKYLIKEHCNDLNRYMPFMFETIEGYTAILFPDGLLAPDSLLRKMTDIDVIPEDNWENIEVIGWLYQYYIADEKDRVFKAKKKYKAEEIPFATQLFTPDWIVQYMVQNSLGRIWLESHPEHKDLQENWEFYLESQDENIEEKLAPYINKVLNVEDIKCFDPAMGSGHILVYMFDVLYEIYSKNGYMEREIPKLIIENNLYGLDIDDRAYQLACFSVVMKAMEYDKRFLRVIEREGLSLNLSAIQETNLFLEDDIAYLAGENKGKDFDDVKAFFQQYQHAKSIGSLIKVTHCDMKFLQERLRSIEGAPLTDLFEMEKRDKVLSLLPKLIIQTEIMRREYDVLVTNPPYMSSRSMNQELTDYLGSKYQDSRRDLFAAFMELDHFLKKDALFACINQHSWMFLSSFEKLRRKVISEKNIENMLHLGPRAFEEISGEVVQSTAFVLRNSKISNSKGTYLRLIEGRTAGEKRNNVIEAVQNLSTPYRYLFDQDYFEKIPGSPIAYWLRDRLIKVFDEGLMLSEVGEPREGIHTGDTNKYVRMWTEINFGKFSNSEESYESIDSNNKKWIAYNKGGPYRKWYGNKDFVIAFDEKTRSDMSKLNGHVRPSQHLYFKKGMTWTLISSTSFGVRTFEEGMLFDVSSHSFFSDEESYLYFAGLLNTKIVRILLEALNPTLNFSSGVIGKLPVLQTSDNEKNKKIRTLVSGNISISRNDWDCFESSWDFSQHPLLKYRELESRIDKTFGIWRHFTESQFMQLKQNEEELNRIFIDIYGLQEELTPEVDDKDVTISKANLERDIKSFISYAIGCSFGRYSLDKEGLIYAGGKFDSTCYETFHADEDNILPILPGAYFKDDIVTRLVEFVKVTYGQESLSENLDFVADAIGRQRNETARETLRRYFMNDFYKDHVQTYQKRPIYWQFTSGKEKAFNCLIYMHRYDKSTLSRIRTDYLHEYQVRLDSEKENLLEIIDGDSPTKEINVAKRELISLDKKIAELKKYDEVLHHMADMQIEIDLDDGVKVNYEKFDGLVVKI